jgi:hypothetical protein
MTSIAIDRTDGLSSSTAIKGPCRVATTANIALYGEQTIDGIAVVTGDRVLVKNQTAGYENGLYVADTGQWRRSKDFNKTRDVVTGTQVLVSHGDLDENVVYAVTTANPVIVGSGLIEFELVHLTDSAAAEAAKEAAEAAQAAAEAAAAAAATVSATFVANLTALKALDTTLSTSAYLKQSGMEGNFVWRAGDYSSQISTDTLGGVFVKANSIAATSGAWVRVTSGALRPEWFGAVGDAVTNDNAALQVWAAVANLMILPVLTLSKIYKKTAILNFTSESFQMVGTGSGSGFLNNNCDGFNLTQAFHWSSCVMRDFVNLTDQVNTRTGFVYFNSGATTTDGINTRRIDRVVSMGVTRWQTPASPFGGWVYDFKLVSADGFHLCGCMAYGDANEAATGSAFTTETFAYYIQDSTNLVVENCEGFLRKYGVYGTGQSESCRVQGGDYISVYNGIDFSTATSPSNDLMCFDVDMAFFHTGIDLGSAMGSTHEMTMATVVNCLLFCGFLTVGISTGATYVKAHGYGNLITGCYFYSSDNTAGTYHTIGVDLSYGNDGFSPPIGNAVTNNIFYHQYKALNVQTNVQDTTFAGNTFIDDGTDLTTSGVDPVTNLSTFAVIYGQNFGDRANYCKYTMYQGSGIKFGVTAGLAFSMTNVAGTAVNWLDVIPAIAAAPPQLRALGSDTNIDLRLTPKGSGNVTTNAAFRTGGNIADPAGAATVGATVNQVGLISAHQAASAPLKLGTASATQIASFYYGTNLVGSIGIGASSVTYNTSSDRRLKEDILDLDADAASAFIDALKPRTFTMNGVATAGFVADEFQAVSPLSVTGESGSVDEDGNPIYQTMQASTAEVIANMVAMLKSLQAQIDRIHVEMQ